MQLVITIRRDVPDRDTGAAIYEAAKERLSPIADLKVSGHVTNHFDDLNTTEGETDEPN